MANGAGGIQFNFNLMALDEKSENHYSDSEGGKSEEH